MGTRALLAFIFVICAVSGTLHAYSMQGVNSLMSQYAVPGSVANGLGAVSLTYSGHTYVALYQGDALYFLVNATDANAYSFVLNSTTIFNVIRGHAVSASVLTADFSAAAAQMHLYQDSSAAQISDCLLETGLSSGDTCTLNNTCYSCQIVPVCRKVLTATGGANGTFGLGVMTFAAQTAQLNESFNAFYSAAAAVNTSNDPAELSRMNAAFFNISNITQVIYQNPIFPPTASSAALQPTCNGYLSLPISRWPWYCTAVGFCAGLNYNYTKLDQIRVMLNNINALPISDSQVQAIASNASANAGRYVTPVLSVQQQARLARLLNATLPGYGALVSNATSLLTHVRNSSLSYDLATLQSSYANVTSNYATVNLTVANRTLSAQYATVARLYGKLNATYSALTGRAQNNTEKLLELQLKGDISPDVANLAFQESALNSAIFSGGLGSLASLAAQANSISQRLSSYSTGVFTLTELARAVDGPFIRAFASGLGLGYSDAVSLAPLLGALLSLIIGAVVFALVLLYRSRMHRRHKVVLNHRTRRNWTIFLAFLLVLVLLYVLATYLLLSQAGYYAPFSAVKGALGSSRQLVVAINGTPTAEEYACANAIRAQLLAENRTVEVVTFASGLCNAGNVTESTDACLGAFAGAGVPVVVLAEGAAQNVSAYSLYGTRLTLSGPAGLMDSCYVQYMVR